MELVKEIDRLLGEKQDRLNRQAPRPNGARPGQAISETKRAGLIQYLACRLPSCLVVPLSPSPCLGLEGRGSVPALNRTHI